MKVRYFDNAATSWPKPPIVKEAMMECMDDYAANPGRGNHRMADRASRTLFETRVNLSKLFNIRNPVDISFALNTTMALNQAILGFAGEGDHVICTAVEHNSVRRPLEFLKRTKQVELTYIQAKSDGNIEADAISRAIKANTKLVIVNHSSNLLGTILPIAEIGHVCQARGVAMLVDAAQTAGTLSIDVQAMGIDMLAFPGHKGLLGPQGTGGLYINPALQLEPLLHGGTGSLSEAIEQPAIRPDRYEAGTQNTVGLAGLNAGVQFILNETTEKIHHKEWHTTQKLMEGLQAIRGVELYGPSIGDNKTAIVAFNLAHMDPSEVAFVLDQHFQIAVRAGYHCTPLAHEIAGTFGRGAVRASPGYFTTDEEVEAFIEAVEQLSIHG